MALTGL